MKKFLLAALLVIGSVTYAVFSRATTVASTALPVEVSTTTTPVATVPTSSSPSPTPTPTPVTTPTPTPVPTPTKSGTYADGTYTGTSVDAYYGYVQVAAVISGGKLTNVKVLQYPNDRRDSIEINQQALPMLIREAISAQSANIDGISGASDTSPAFIESLSSALAKAKA